VRVTYSGIPADQKRTWVVPRWLKEAFVAFAAVAVLAVGISKAVQHFGGRTDRAKGAVEADDLDGQPAPMFKELQDLKGKLVLINFWATWCPPCREEMPSLMQLAKSFDPASFEVLSVSVDDGWEAVNKFFASPPPFKVVLDRGAKWSQTYGTSKYPESYLVDREGKLRLKFVGPRDWTDPNFRTLFASYGAHSLSAGTDAKSAATAQTSPR
jgi:thiol-disulfide isomerase/thioredoxin